MPFENLTQKATSSVKDGLGSVLGVGSKYPLYDKFFNAILSDADNAMPESSHWIGFFSFPVPPKAVDNRSLANRIKDTASSLKETISKTSASDIKGFFTSVSKTPTNNIFGSIFSSISNDLDVHPWSLGDKANKMANSFTTGLGTSVMFLTGVELPGDGFGVDRPSNFNVGGFLKSPITNPRNDLKQLSVSFLENNSSLVDLVIRPWLIDSSYKSLKFARSATFNVFNLTRSPTGFRVRKEFVFYHVVPISIDSERFEYSAQSSYGIRQLEFVYSDYVIKEGEGLHDSLFDSVLNVVKRTTLNAATSIIEGGVDIAVGGASRVITNAAGAFTGAVRDVVVDVQGRAREFTKNAEDSLISKASSAAEKIIGSSQDKDHISRNAVPSPSSGVFSSNEAIIIQTNKNDAISDGPLPIKQTTIQNNVTYTIKSVPGVDVPDISKLGTTIIPAKDGDSSFGKNIFGSVVGGASMDIPDTKELNIAVASISNNVGEYTPVVVDLDNNDVIRR